MGIFMDINPYRAKNLLATTFATFGFALLTSNTLAQCMMIPLPLEQRVNQSELIVEGKVIAKQSYWDAKHQQIYTSNTVEVYKVLKGAITTDKIEVLTEGGIVDDKIMNVGVRSRLFLNY